MGRFSNMKALNEVVSDAALATKQVVMEKKAPQKKIDRMVYNINPDLFEAIENSSESFSSFAKRAMEKVAREEGKLKQY